MKRSRLHLLVGVAVSVVLHGVVLAVVFLVPPPKRDPVARERPPVRVRLASLPKPPPKKQEPALKSETPKIETKKPEDKKPEDKKPEDKKPEDKKPEVKKPEDKKPEDKKPEAKKPEVKKPEDRKPKDRKPKDRKKPEPKKTETPPPVVTPPVAPQKPARKFTAEIPEGPGGGVAVPSGPEEGGSRFGAPDGSPDGSLDEKFRPGGDRAAPPPKEEDDEEVVEITSVSKPPRLLRQPSADELRREYPEVARRAGQEADVRLRVLVGVDGRVTNAKIVTSAGPSFDAAAKRLARRLRFEPAQRDGRKVAVWTPPFPIKFRLDE